MRRSIKQLQRAIADASGDHERALAWYELGVFHDNNNREAEAVPCYEQALALGLDSETEARALSWLASSLYKTDRFAEAWKHSEQAMEKADRPGLKKFLVGLQARIKRRRAEQRS